MVAAGEGEARQTGGFEGKRGDELEAVGRAQRVGAKKPEGELAHGGSGVDLVPCRGEIGETFARELGSIGVDGLLAQAALEGGFDFGGVLGCPVFDLASDFNPPRGG